MGWARDGHFSSITKRTGHIVGRASSTLSVLQSGMKHMLGGQNNSSPISDQKKREQFLRNKGLKRIVRSQTFDLVCGAAIPCNAIYIGVQTQYVADHPMDKLPDTFGM